MAAAAASSATSHGIPPKTREFHNHHMDSRVWDEVKFRPDDIVITTYAKSGTTWTQQIVSQLIHQGDGTVAAGPLSPWVDLRVIPRDVILPMLEGQTHRRFMKTHLPIDALRTDPNVKYIFIGRDGRDMMWSAHNHFHHANQMFYDLFNQAGDFPGPKLGQPPSDNPRDLVMQLIEGDGNPDPALLWPFWSHIRGWWAVRNEPNVLFVHFNDLKADLGGEMKRIAQFLDIPEMPEDKWNAAVEHCTFAWMKEHSDMSAPPQSELVFEQGSKTFINKGTNQRWRDALSEEDCRRYEERAERELGAECAQWLQYGNQKRP